MTTIETEDDHQWAPQACTLPTAERPLRVAEFDDLLPPCTASTGPAPPCCG